MLFLYGMLTATAAIIAAEIVFNYGLGDKLKDLFVAVEKRIASLESRIVKLKAKL